MNDKSKQTTEKLYGVFYTPYEIVDFLSNWATEDFQRIEVLEPSAGDGRFVEYIVSKNKDASITAVEIDSVECEKIRKINNTKVINDDFYNFYESVKDKGIQYDVVIGNPPYIRYQFLSEEQREYQSDILKRNGMKANKLINSWVAFTVAGIEMCKSGGKFAFVLPTDLLQVSYAKELRKFIFKKLETVTIISFDSIVFEGIQQDVVLIFGVKRNLEEKGNLIRNIHLKDMSQLTKDISLIPFENYEFDYSDKWRKFLLNKDFLEFYEGSFLHNTNSINDFANIEVGITTGNNKVFVVDELTINNYKLDEYKVPLIGRSLDATGLFYTKDDIENNSRKGRKVWLLDFNNKELKEGAHQYIRDVVNRNEHQGYKLGLRHKWFEIPSIWIPEAFLLRRMGKFPKIVKNAVEATSTDTFHRVKFKNNVDFNKFLVLFYSSACLLTFELEGRVFGGGALEILPGDLKNIRLPVLADDGGINFEKVSQELDIKLRQKEDISELVKWVDELIQPYSKFNSTEFKQIYNTWENLREKRTE